MALSEGWCLEVNLMEVKLFYFIKLIICGSPKLTAITTSSVVPINMFMMDVLVPLGAN